MQIDIGNFSCVFRVLKRIDGYFYAVKNSTRLLHQYTERIMSISSFKEDVKVTLIGELAQSEDNVFDKSPNWQDISPVAAIGYVVVDKLLTVQNKSYGHPTILMAKSVQEEEDIPDGAVAMMILDMLDVLSHVSVRARNIKQRS
ncbi:unnamed protein product [Camellia sinensis]